MGLPFWCLDGYCDDASSWHNLYGEGVFIGMLRDGELHHFTDVIDSWRKQHHD